MGKINSPSVSRTSKAGLCGVGTNEISAIRLPQVGDTAVALRLGEVSAWGRPDKALKPDEG